jgi:hypothetical protein
MELDHFEAPARLAQLLGAWHAMTRAAREAEAGRLLVAEVRGIGQGVAFSGGWPAMQKIDKAVAAIGAPNHHLYELWDGIGAWVS